MRLVHVWTSIGGRHSLDDLSRPWIRVMLKVAHVWTTLPRGILPSFHLEERPWTSLGGPSKDELGLLWTALPG